MFIHRADLLVVQGLVHSLWSGRRNVRLRLAKVRERIDQVVLHRFVQLAGPDLLLLLSIEATFPLAARVAGKAVPHRLPSIPASEQVTL